MIAHIVGARPNFVKAGPVVHACETAGLPQAVIHTGQHYDEALSAVFFDELGLPEPDVDLGVGSDTHARQTAALMIGLEEALTQRSPDVVVVYGDVNSTVAAALVAVKLGMPVAHVEAGLRSFDWTMPEEVNRKVTDSLSDLCFVTSPEGIAHLGHEGVPADRIHFVGNPMIDTLLANRDRFDANRFRNEHDLDGDYGMVTLHRPHNVDDPDDARRVVQALAAVGERLPLLLPLHPRGRETLAEAGLFDQPGIRVVDPVSYVEFLSGVRGSSLVITDSGGVQEETTILDVPCITVRPNTERPVTVTHGTNQLVTPEELSKAASAVLDGEWRAAEERPPLWDGRSGRRIARVLSSRVTNGVEGPSPVAVNDDE